MTSISAQGVTVVMRGFTTNKQDQLLVRAVIILSIVTHAIPYQMFLAVAFIRADHSTCNGILPHPALPYFITYGIDSTVKLWRATIPIDNNIDDSDAVSDL
jgi:hypothetical protein